MRLVSTGRGSEVRVQFDVNSCSGCGASFGRLGSFSPVPHGCQQHRAHYELCCRTCGASTWDSRCTVVDEPHNPLAAHAADGQWDIQEGPTLDVGDG